MVAWRKPRLAEAPWAGYKEVRGSVVALPPPRIGSRLELESNCNLYLALAEHCIAVCVGETSEGRLVRERRNTTHCADRVPRVIHTGDVLVIEQIKGLPQQFKAIALGNSKALRDAQVHVRGVRLPQAIAP